MKMPGPRSGFHISDILELNEGKGLGGGLGAEPQISQPLGTCVLPDFPAYPQHHYPHDFLRHHQPWLSLEHHDTNGKTFFNVLYVTIIAPGVKNNCCYGCRNRSINYM